ncbi:MAG: MFS transporter [bacterium]|nr:MFS transporter [bacterium]
MKKEVEQTETAEKPASLKNKSEKRSSNPWWIAKPVFGKAPMLEQRLFSLLGFVTFALFFENYDYSLLGSCLKYIAEDLNIAEAKLGYFTALIRLGSLPAIFIIPMVDFFGRKRLFLLSVAGSGLGTMLTAFSQTDVQFVAIQIFTRTFLLTGSAIAIVIITEEFPAEHRGWGIGILSGLAVSGYGFGSLLFSFVDYFPYGWRFLYFLGFLSLLVLPLLSRNIVETTRFKQFAQEGAHVAGNTFTNWLRPMRELFAQYPRRAFSILSIAFLTHIGHSVVMGFIGYYVLTTLQWMPWQYSVMTILCGGIAIPGNAIAGRLADRYGRRKVGSLLLLAFPICSWCFYQGPEYIIVPVWIVMLFSAMSTLIIIRALASELFPTETRGTASGAVSLMETVGAGVGLFSISILTELHGDLTSIIPLIGTVPLLAGILIFTVPETKSKKLESISH